MTSSRLFWLLTVLFASQLASPGTLAATDAFECTAEDGSISYMDTKPATGCVNIRVVHINVGKGSSATTQTTAGNAPATGDGTTPGASDANDDKEMKERASKAKEACDTKKSNLDILKSRTFVQTKGEDGKLRTLSAEEQQKNIRDIQQYIENFCK